jgi:hypothetical protein
MNTMNRFARKLFALSLLSVGLATATFANAAGTQFVGPRNTIPRAQSAEQLSSQLPVDQLRASRDDTSVCQAVRRVHHGHPGKGLDRIERVDVPCGKTRLSTR